MAKKTLYVIAAVTLVGCGVTFMDMLHQEDELHRAAIRAKTQADGHLWNHVDTCQEAAIVALRTTNRAVQSSLSGDRSAARADYTHMLEDCKKAGIEPGKSFSPPDMDEHDLSVPPDLAKPADMAKPTTTPDMGAHG